MRIGVDARKAADYGIGTYVRNLAHELVRLDRNDDWVFFHRPGDEGLLPSGDRVIHVPERSGGYSLGELTAFAGHARALRLDLFHAPHYVLPFRLPCPAVVTVHDVIHLLVPEYGGLRRLYARFMIGHAVSAAARVITVSRASERDIVRFFPKAARRIAVIPNGVEEVFHPSPPGEAAARVGARLGFTGDYLLFVGNPKGHKNLDLLLHGFVKLVRLFPELRLVAAGGEERQRRELARTAERLGIAARTHFIAPVSREALADLYDAATVFVFPSLYEGFGLPPLEAMACGAPVAASSSASIPEVLGPAARYFSPESVDSLVATVVGLLEDPALRKRLSSLGRERARDFTWEEAARHTLAVYREALEQ